MRAVCRFESEQTEAKRDHDQGEMAEARNDETDGKADNAGNRRGEYDAAQRFAPADTLRADPAE